MKFDVIIIGGGLSGMTAAAELQNAGKRCAVITDGLSLNPGPASRFTAAGGTVIPANRVCDFEAEGNKVISVRTDKLSDTALEAADFILATGKYFSRGLVADMDKVYEPIFGADVEYDPDRNVWFGKSFSTHQKFLEFGVRTSADGKVLVGGVEMSNLWAAGEILAGITSSEGDATRTIRESAIKVSQKIAK